MIILISLIALLIIGFISYNYNELLSVILVFISGACLLLVMIAWPASYYETLSKINQYEVIKQTIEISRKENISDIERAALTNKIIEMNTWIASVQYDNKHMFELFTPDAVDTLEYLK